MKKVRRPHRGIRDERNERNVSIPLSENGFKRGKGRNLLKSLEISDNIHSQYAKNARENPNEFRSRRNHRAVNYVFTLRGRNHIIEDEVGEFPDDRGSTRISNSRPVRYHDWKLPKTLEEVNGLNPNVQFIVHQSDPDEFVGAYELSKVKIRYNPLKLLNFQRLLSASSALCLDGTTPHYCHDFDICESEDLINILDNDSTIPYRCAIANKSDFSTAKTAPTFKDREFFEKLLVQSSTASYYNANVLLANHEEATTEEEDRPIRSRIVRGRPKSFQPRKTHSKNYSRSASIECIYLRDYEIETWYTTPYPEEYNRNKVLYICEYCLKYMNSRYVYHRHQLKCSRYRPPGNEIYRDGKISVWEVDGRESVIYCQNLCLLAKLFLNSKTLYYDVEPFNFYILTEREDFPKAQPRFHLVGYFSKEKLNSTDYNLSCILTLPIYQRKGYGHFLMDFSYLLTRREFKWGTPEKPLSDLGLLSYRNFWKMKCAQVLINLKKLLSDDSMSLQISLEDISNLTGMIPTDVVFGLEQLQVLVQSQPEADEKIVHYAVKIDSWERIEGICEKWNSKGYQNLDPTKLVWKPMIFGPSCGVNAVGTMVETTTGATRNTTGHAEPDQDFFKRSISMLVNFLKDDVSDPRQMEEVAWQKIQERERVTMSEFDSKMQWELCYKESRDTLNGSIVSGNTEIANEDPVGAFCEVNGTQINSVGETPEQYQDDIASIQEDGYDEYSDQDTYCSAPEEMEMEEEEEEVVEEHKTVHKMNGTISRRLRRLEPKEQRERPRHHLRGRIV